MSRARHKMRADGGKLNAPGKPVWNAGGEQNAAKEAEEKKRGGKVGHAEGESAKKRADHKERKRGGHVKHEEKKEHERKHGGKVPGRARGGGVGADRTPLTTASKVKHVTKGELPEEGVYDGKGEGPSDD
jgi:hypothetical protein